MQLWGRFVVRVRGVALFPFSTPKTGKRLYKPAVLKTLACLGGVEVVRLFWRGEN